MRAEPNNLVDPFRRMHHVLGGSPSGRNFGYFVYGECRIISSGTPDPENEFNIPNEWEHVSVSCIDRCPSWDEMSAIKELFWEDSETVMQFHPMNKQYINLHPFTLHMWKKVGVNSELPPKWLIA